MNLELWVDHVKILEPDFKINQIENHEDLVIVEIERLSIEEKCGIFNFINKGYEVYFDKNILDELKSFGYVGFSYSDEDDIFIMKVKVIKAVERDNLKQRIEKPRKRYVCN